MLITRTSIITGITRTLEIPVSSVQIEDWQNGTCIRDAMPELNSDQREYIFTGVIAEEWQEYIIEI
jgi:hypothetical protein